MNVKIDIEMLLGYADDYRSSLKRFWETRAKHGYPKGRTYWGGTVKEIDDMYEWYDRAYRVLNEICFVTGISFDSMVHMSRIMERYYDSDTYQVLNEGFSKEDHEHLYEVLTAKEPETGIYRNEYFEKACDRQARMRYERYFATQS